MAFSMSDAILIEKILSPQIAIASSSDKYLLFSRLCKHRLGCSFTISKTQI